MTVVTGILVGRVVSQRGRLYHWAPLAHMHSDQNVLLNKLTLTFHLDVLPAVKEYVLKYTTKKDKKQKTP